MTGKISGGTVTAAELFTFSNGATSADVTGVTGTGVTWDNATKVLTIGASTTGTVALAFTVGTGVDKAGTAQLTSVAAPKTVTGKAVAGKKGGGTVTAAELFTFSNGATSADVTGVTGTGVTWDNTAKVLTIAAATTGNVALTFNVGTGVAKAGTASLTGVTAP